MAGSHSSVPLASGKRMVMRTLLGQEMLRELVFK